jgi:hypothetical protein
LFFKLEVYEDDIGDMLVQEQSYPDKSDQEKNSKRNVITKDIEQVWCLSVGIIMIIFYIIKILMFSNQTMCMNDEKVLRRKCRRFIVESDTDDGDQMMNLKN